MWPLYILATPFNQFLKKIVILGGGGILKLKQIDSPYIFAKGQEKVMLDCLILVTKITFSTTLSSLVNQIILSENHLSTKKPHVFFKKIVVLSSSKCNS
jgi:hypothetical protein